MNEFGGSTSRHQRLDTPKSKEIKKLLQPVILYSPHTTPRECKSLSKRHPDTIYVRMMCDRTVKWIEAVFGLQLASSLANSPYHTPDVDHEIAPTTLASPKVTVESIIRRVRESHCVVWECSDGRRPERPVSPGNLFPHQCYEP
jgi:hypothetical protein